MDNSEVIIMKDDLKNIYLTFTNLLSNE